MDLLVVDDQPVVREGLRALLDVQRDMRVVRMAADARELVPLFERCRPDVVVTDVDFGGVSALDAIRALRRRHPSARVVVLTACADEASVSRAVAAGVQGYVLKSDPTSAIVDAVRAVHAGRHYLTPSPSERLLEHAGAPELTPREQQVLDLLAHGNSNRRIGTSLGIAEETVKGHVKNILLKLGASSRTEAVAIAIRKGFVRVAAPG